MLPFTARAIWLFIMHGSIESSMKQIGEALLETLTAIGRIKTDQSKLGVVSERGPRVGQCSATLSVELLTRSTFTSTRSGRFWTRWRTRVT